MRENPIFGMQISKLWLTGQLYSSCTPIAHISFQDFMYFYQKYCTFLLCPYCRVPQVGFIGKRKRIINLFHIKVQSTIDCLNEQNSIFSFQMMHFLCKNQISVSVTRKRNSWDE